MLKTYDPVARTMCQVSVPSTVARGRFPMEHCGKEALQEGRAPNWVRNSSYGLPCD